MMMFFAASKPCSTASTAALVSTFRRFASVSLDTLRSPLASSSANRDNAERQLFPRGPTGYHIGCLFRWVHDESTSTQALAEVVLQSETSCHV